MLQSINIWYILTPSGVAAAPLSKGETRPCISRSHRWWEALPSLFSNRI